MTVIGAGSWGTALAIQLAREGHPAELWGRDGLQLDAMRRARRNERYLPDAAFPDNLRVTNDLSAALKGARDALIAVPSHAFRATLESIKPHLGHDTRVAWATKGFEIATGLLPHQVARQVLGSRPGAVLSGPTFAKEVGADGELLGNFPQAFSHIGLINAAWAIYEAEKGQEAPDGRHPDGPGESASGQ